MNIDQTITKEFNKIYNKIELLLKEVNKWVYSIIVIIETL